MWRAAPPGAYPGAYLTGDDPLEGLDAAFFGIAPAEAGSLDPRHRLALQEAAHALDDAGPPSLPLPTPHPHSPLPIPPPTLFDHRRIFSPPPIC